MERCEGEVRRVRHQSDHGDHDEHRHSQQEEKSGPSGGEVDPPHHKIEHDRRINQRQRLPRDRDVQVVLQDDLRPAARDIDDGRHGDDIAEAHNQGCGDGHDGAEGLADKGNERAGRRNRARELGQGVAQQSDRNRRHDDGEGRGHACDRGNEREAEEEAHRGRDIGHRRRRDVHQVERPSLQARNLRYRTKGFAFHGVARTQLTRKRGDHILRAVD